MIECYESSCQFHSVHQFPDDGPLCYQAFCRMKNNNVVSLHLNGKPANIFGATFGPDFTRIVVGYGETRQFQFTVPPQWWDSKMGTTITNGQTLTWHHTPAGESND